jgi:GntR family transcriptional regulator
MTLNRESVLPLYHQIKEKIRGRIVRGEYGIDERVPSENELAEKYGVSRNTAKQAIAELVSEGILFRIQGRGTFVSPKKVFHGVSEHLSFSDEFGPDGGSLTTKVLSIEEMPASRDTAEALQIDDRDLIVVVRRLRFLDGEPFSLQVSFLAKDLVPTLVNQDLESRSLFDLLSMEYGLVPQRAEEYLECKPASDFECEPMGVPHGYPLFRLSRTTYDNQDRVVEVVETYLPSDRCRFHFHRVKDVKVMVKNGDAEL